MKDEKLDRCSKYGMRGMWIRAVYMAGFQDHSITAVVRAGDRVSDTADYRHLPAGEELPVRFIKKPGSGHDIPAELYPDDGTTVRRTEAIVKSIGELTEEDLRGTTPDTATAELVRYHLGSINNSPLPGLDEKVTIWRFEYCEPGG